jgi:HAD superfamily hydrolase (TIGR01450 family)
MNISSITLNKLQDIQCFLLDLDGTFTLDDHLLPGALEIQDWFTKNKIRYLFLTNNSSKNNTDYLKKLTGLGLKINSSNIFTSGQATAIYLQNHHPGKKVYILGTPSLIHELKYCNVFIDDVNPDILVLGFDTSLTYEKLSKFCDFVRKGKYYIATHSDINCPTRDGFIPDVGSFIELIKASAGRIPDLVIGKPNKPIVDALCYLISVSPSHMAMIGDRLYTDMAMRQHGIKTILVLTGETKLNELENSPFRPDYIVENLTQLL